MLHLLESLRVELLRGWVILLVSNVRKKNTMQINVLNVEKTKTTQKADNRVWATFALITRTSKMATKTEKTT